MVYVINYNGEALMPTRPSRAKKLLKTGRAKCIKVTPFTIKLTRDSQSYTQNLFLGIDTGSKFIGSAVVNSKNDVIYLSQIEIRNDISDKMKQRSKYRRSRRNRKTRYREPRWLNRKNSIKNDRFGPTMNSKINSHLKEINFVKSILPITETIIETSVFDTHALKDPLVLKNKWLYQKGINYGFENTRSFVLSRDKYTCQYCKGKSNDIKLEVHHILFKSNGGSDDEDNLITLCKTHHDMLHQDKISLNKPGKIKSWLKHATQMNSIRIQLLRKESNAIETFGYITRVHRQYLGLSKKHYNDAISIACLNNIIKTEQVDLNFKTNTILFKKCVPDGDYQQSKGIHSQQKIPTCKINGFRKFDKVLYLGNEYFIKGRMSTGYAKLMDINGDIIQFNNAIRGMKTPKLNNMKRISSRKSWIMQENNYI